MKGEFAMKENNKLNEELEKDNSLDDDELEKVVGGIAQTTSVKSDKRKESCVTSC